MVYPLYDGADEDAVTRGVGDSHHCFVGANPAGGMYNARRLETDHAS